MTTPYAIVAFETATPFGLARRVGAKVGDTIIDLRNAYHGHLEHAEKDPAAAALAEIRFPDTTLAFIRGGAPSWEAVRAALDFARSSGPRAEIGGTVLQLAFTQSEIRLRPAIEPGKMICAGRNYRAHQQESGGGSDDFPRGFVKVGTTLLADDSSLPFPQATKELDFEVELALVIGRRVRDVGTAEALDCVYGYTIFNDLSARDWQFAESRAGNHLLGKNLDGLGPLGPCIVPRAFLPDPMNLRLTLRVNGVTRQEASTSDMIFDIPTLIAHWSKMTLEPGDLIATGTPEGTAMGVKPRNPAAFLKPGDIVEAEVEGIGVLTTRIT